MKGWIRLERERTHQIREKESEDLKSRLKKKKNQKPIRSKRERTYQIRERKTHIMRGRAAWVVLPVSRGLGLGNSAWAARPRSRGLGSTAWVVWPRQRGLGRLRQRGLGQLELASPFLLLILLLSLSLSLSFFFSFFTHFYCFCILGILSMNVCNYFWVINRVLET